MVGIRYTRGKDKTRTDAVASKEQTSAPVTSGILIIPAAMRSRCDKADELYGQRKFLESRKEVELLVAEVSGEEDIGQRIDMFWGIWKYWREKEKEGRGSSGMGRIFEETMRAAETLEFPAKLERLCMVYRSSREEGALGNMRRIFEVLMGDILSPNNEYTHDDFARIEALDTLAACLGQHDRSERRRVRKEVVGIATRLIESAQSPNEQINIIFRIYSAMHHENSIAMFTLNQVDAPNDILSLSHTLQEIYRIPDASLRIKYLCELRSIFENAKSEENVKTLEKILARILYNAAMACSYDSVKEAARLYNEMADHAGAQTADRLLKWALNGLRPYIRFVTDVTELCDAAQIVCAKSPEAAGILLNFASDAAHLIEDPQKQAGELEKITAATSKLRLV